MQPNTKNPRFSNPLVNSSSPYLKQHAANPVFWYPWGREAIGRARDENKPILLSVGYSTCYWCHVMEREVFENLSIASLMNKFFINIKVDREEHPELDELYMIARQMLTKEGGWPNHVFLTPELKPFYAGGTFAPDESYAGKPAFPRLLEWMNASWVEKEDEVRAEADKFAELMQPFAQAPAPQESAKPDVPAQSAALFKALGEYHDARSGGFFQAPKFPHENYLAFLLTYYETSGDGKALDIAAHSLGKMAAGGIYDHVAGGFHRYAVDKEWYVPHFEKMLYNQAMLASLYTRLAVHTGSTYFKDIARSILDFTAGPLTDGDGAFYAAIDAETDGVEGAYYAWNAKELEDVLTEEERKFFVNFYALADIPAFAGHKHPDGQALIARKPLPAAARDAGMPYEQLAAMSGQVLNKLLEARNQRKAPHLDDKIITSWNGLMIAAYAQAGEAFAQPLYTEIAQKAADTILEQGFDEEGVLLRIIGAKTKITAKLEDYACLLHGLIALQTAAPEDERLEVIESLAERAEELFWDDTQGGYFLAQKDEFALFRMKGGDDSSLPSANAIMLQNLAALHKLTEKDEYKQKAEALRDYFLSDNQRPVLEFSSMLQGALMMDGVNEMGYFEPRDYSFPRALSDIIDFTAKLAPANARPGDICEVVASINIMEGWHINAHDVSQPDMVPTQLDVQGQGVEKLDITLPQAEKHGDIWGYSGQIAITARIRLPQGQRPAIKVLLRAQPCSEQICHKVQDLIVSI